MKNLTVSSEPGRRAMHLEVGLAILTHRCRREINEVVCVCVRETETEGQAERQRQRHTEV